MSTSPVTPDGANAEESEEQKETPLEALASICTVLAVGLFLMAFAFQNFEIPSASMEKTLLIGDHLLVDRITFLGLMLNCKNQEIDVNSARKRCTRFQRQYRLPEYQAIEAG